MEDLETNCLLLVYRLKQVLKSIEKHFVETEFVFFRKRRPSSSFDLEIFWLRIHCTSHKDTIPYGYSTKSFSELIFFLEWQTFPGFPKIGIHFCVWEASTMARILVVSELRAETKGSHFPTLAASYMQRWALYSNILAKV